MITECVACSRRRHFAHVTQVQGFRTCLPHYDRRWWEISYQLEFEHKSWISNSQKEKLKYCQPFFFFFFFFLLLPNLMCDRDGHQWNQGPHFLHFQIFYWKFRTLEENGHLKVFYLVNQLKNIRSFLFGGIWGGQNFVWGMDIFFMRDGQNVTQFWNGWIVQKLHWNAFFSIILYEAHQNKAVLFAI